MAPRLCVLIPIITSAAAFALALVLLIGGSSPSNGSANYWLALNTSRVGQDLIQLSPATTPAWAPPAWTIPLGLAGPLEALVQNVTAQLDDQLEAGERALVGNLTRALGIRDVYTLYLAGLCAGDFVGGDTNPVVRIDTCRSYDVVLSELRDAAAELPSSFVVGTTNVSVPLVGSWARSIAAVAERASSGAKAMFALLIVGAVCVGLVLLASLVVLVAGYRRGLVIVATVFALLGSNVLFTFALTTTGLIVGNNSGDLNAAYGIQTRQGTAFLAMSWVSAALAALTCYFWFTVWCVNSRRTSFKRRWRTQEQIGNYRGAWGELRGDLRKPEDQPLMGKEISSGN